MSATTSPLVLLIAGMHRSGTSALTRVISLRGAALPTNLQRPAPDNPRGFWESREVADLNDEILATISSAWHDVLPISRAWFDSEAAEGFAHRAAELLRQDMPESGLFVLKDPRICRLMPLWLRAVDLTGASPRVILPFRHPWEVAKSLQARNGFPLRKGLFLWLRHVIEAERDSRTLPRSLVSYDELMEDWRRTTRRIAKDLGLSWPVRPSRAERAVQDFLDTKLRHHSAPDAEADGLIGHLALDLFQQATEEATLSDAVDAAARALAPYEEVFAPVVQDITGRMIQAASKAERNMEERQRAEARLAHEAEERQRAEARLAHEVEERLAHEAEERRRAEARLAHEAEERRYAEARLALEAEERVLAETRVLHLRKRLAQLQAQGDRASERQREAAPALLEALRRRRESPSRRRLLLRDLTDLARTPLFDPRHYLAVYREVSAAGENPFVHYLLHGQRRRPHPLFDAGYYVSRNPDAEQADMPALLHYLRVGAHQGRAPHPLFDPAYYLRHCPQATTGSLTPLEHYVLHGGPEGYPPHPLFDAAGYLERHPELRNTRQSPLEHYLLNGVLSDESPHPLFDNHYYLKTYPDIAEAGVPPLYHYVTWGAAEARNPNPDFDAGAYMRRHPEIEETGENPLIHFMRTGATQHATAEDEASV